jgi:hypothetical protein
MKLPTACLLLMLLLGAADAAAQTLQLPSLHYFATDSSVVVPDLGQVALGGINSRSSGQNQFGGPPGSRSRGAASQASGASVTAYVHDFDAWDQALLAEAASRRRPRTLAATGAGPTSASPPPLASVADLEQHRAAAQATAGAEAEKFFAQAEQAKMARKPGLARVYYQMAARRAGGELRARALAEIAAASKTDGRAEHSPPR